MSLHHPTDDLSALLQLPDLPDWDFGTDLTTTDLTLPCYTFRDAQLPLVRDEQRFLELLSDRSDSKPSGAAPGALWPGVQDWCTQQGASKTGSGTSSEEPTHSIKQRNKQAQRKCRLRKKVSGLRASGCLGGLHNCNTRLKAGSTALVASTCYACTLVASTLCGKTSWSVPLCCYVGSEPCSKGETCRSASAKQRSVWQSLVEQCASWRSKSSFWSAATCCSQQQPRRLSRGRYTACETSFAVLALGRTECTGSLVLELQFCFMSCIMQGIHPCGLSGIGLVIK